MEQIYNFLSDLKVNNNREWFDANRERYNTARLTFIAFTEILINEIRQFDPSVPLLNPKDCIFRIFRDTRFSNDKTPYKTNFGTFINPGGKKSSLAGYYLHIEPDNCFFAGGAYMPEADKLSAIRDAIFQHTDEYLSIINNDDYTRSFDPDFGDKLKTAPKGFPKDWEHIELIKPKSYGGMKAFDAELLRSPDLLSVTIDHFRALYPLNRFLNQAMGAE